MVRETNIPLFLWIATAILLHLTWGGGAEKISEFAQEQMDIRRFALAVSSSVRQAQTSIEVSIESPDEAPAEPEPTAPVQLSAPSTEATAPSDKTEPPTKQTPPKPQAKPLPKPEAKKAPADLKVEVTPAKPAPPSAVPAQARNRIAVQQQVADKNQAPNPEADLIGEHNNRVSEQTQARITSTEQDDAVPSPGGEYAGPTADPGDSHVTDIAQNEDRAGSHDRAPGNPQDGQEERSSSADPTRAGDDQQKPTQSQSEAPQPLRHASNTAPKPEPGREQKNASAASNESPEISALNDGQFRMADRTPQQPAQNAQQFRRRSLPPAGGNQRPENLLGLGAHGLTANGFNLNLSQSAALATVGKDQLARQLLADGERRRSKHRGSWRASGLEHWRSAIENYVPHVKPGNQTALNTAQVPFALYLNQIHERIHPIFAGQFLSSLDALPGNNPLNRTDMSTNLEIILSGTDGHLVERGVTKASGVTAFDIGALDSVERAAPFGPPPSAIVSPDGNVYLHWEFWRNPDYACSTYFAHPIMLRADPKGAPVEPPLPEQLRPEENPVPNQNRQGGLLPLPEPGSRLASTKE